jgi:hypothetical protein
MTVRPLTGPAFFAALANRWITDAQIELQSPQARYILGYLQNPEVGAQCFIEESPYVDGDYLEDYASFYVSSFPPYERYCRRLHFFDRNFTQEQVDEMLGGADPPDVAALVDSFIGFIVVRPLPEAVIGRTVLRTYRGDGARRHFPTCRRYRPYLNGIELPISSLAFEEQDSSVAACATVALWSAFHKTHFLFGTPRPRPAAITKAANVVRSAMRTIPSGGLNVFQVGEAIRAVGLDPEIFAITGQNPMLASLAYAYLSAGIPLILVVFVEDQTHHAVTVVGYSQPDELAPNPEPTLKGVVSFAGQRIDKLYVHDDGIGPFASIPIAATPAGLTMPDKTSPPLVFETNWRLEQPKDGRETAYFLPECIVVPAYPKVRVPFFAMHDWVHRLMRMFTTFRVPFQNQGLQVDQLTWDIRLSQVNEFKEELRSGPYWPNARIRELAQDFLPRFLWLAIMRHNGVPALLLLADATDAKRSCPILRVAWLDETFRPLLDAVFGQEEIEATWRAPLGPRFYDAIKTGHVDL